MRDFSIMTLRTPEYYLIYLKRYAAPSAGISSTRTTCMYYLWGKQNIGEIELSSINSLNSGSSVGFRPPWKLPLVSRMTTNNFANNSIFRKAVLLHWEALDNCFCLYHHASWPLNSSASPPICKTIFLPMSKIKVATKLKVDFTALGMDFGHSVASYHR